jgi:protein required for attachment to host cells
MTTTWIVAADASRARILQVAGRQRLNEIETLINPEGRMNDRELTTDANPRLHGPGGIQGNDRSSAGTSAREEPSAVEHAVDVFSKRIGDYLEKARTDHRYDQLVLVAPPKLLGKVRKELGKEVEKLVLDEVPKDLAWFNERDLQLYLSDFAKGSARAP